MATSRSLSFVLLGEDKGASKVLNEVGAAAEGVHARTVAMGAAAGAAIADLGSKAVNFAKDSIDKFQQVGGETLKLQRSIGGTTESASRLRFAAEESGVGMDTLSKSVGLLEKHMESNDGAWKSMGISMVDAHGKTKQMDAVLPELAEKFKNMPAGPEKTADALKLFGKAGTDMLPFLNRGAEGIAELEKESDKFGLTLSTKDTQAVKDNIIAKREWGAAITGVQVQLGQFLYPILTKVATEFVAMAPAIRENLRPAFALLGTAAGVVSTAIEHLVPVFSAFGAALSITSGFLERHRTLAQTTAVALGALVVVTQLHAAVLAVSAAGGLAAWILQTNIAQSITKVWAAAQWLLNAALSANPIVLVVVGLAALAAGLVLAYQHCETFRNIVQAAWTGIKVAAEVTVGWFQATAWPLLTAVFNGIGAVVGWLWHNVFDPAWAAISFGFNVMVSMIGAYWGALHEMFNVMAAVVGWVWHAIFEPACGGIAAAWGGLTGAISGGWNWVRDTVFNPLGEFIGHTVPGFFQGGVDAIGRIWNRLTDIVSGPINTMKNWINNDLIGPLNKVTGLFGLTIPTLAGGGGVELVGVELMAASHGRAEGGLIVGPGTGTSDSILGLNARGVPTARVSNGEYVVNADATAKNRGLLEQINTGKLPGFFLGGLIDGAMSQIDDWLNTGIRFATDHILGPAEDLIGRVVPAPEFANKSATGSVHQLHDVIGAWAKKKDDEGGGLPAIKAWIQAQSGKAYSWGGAGPDSYDCSGFTGAVYGKMTGKGGGNGQRYFTTLYDFHSLGFKDGPGGTFTIGVSPSHMVGRYGGLPFEAGHTPIVAGAGAQDTAHFPKQYHMGGDGPGLGAGAGSGGMWLGDSGTPAGGAKGYAQQVLNARGWGDQFGALDFIFTNESGWDPYAVNPSSGAAGIPQALGHGNVFALGDWKAQVDWGINYIAGQYGNPNNAAAFWRAHNWYDQGGILPPGTSLATNATGQNEYVLNQRQMAGMGGDTTVNINLTGPVYGDRAGIRNIARQVADEIANAQRQNGRPITTASVF
jgi:hypothetical protein